MADGLLWMDYGDQRVCDGGMPPAGGRPRSLGPGGEDPEFRILGPVEVRRGGEGLRPGGRRQLAVLTQLVLNVGRVVLIDRLSEGLWGDDPPRAARATLQSYISKLRRLLDVNPAGAADAGVLAQRHGGYLLEVDPETIDARRFERLTAQARTAQATGEVEAAAGLFEDALALWRGPALADFAGEAFAAAEINRLEELRLAASEDHIGVSLALGRHRTVIAELEVLVAAHPFRERLRGLLMVALYRSGRQCEALRVYQAGRRLLSEELGIDPTPAIKSLEGAILRQDPALEWTPRACAPVPMGSRRNRGVA